MLDVADSSPVGACPAPFLLQVEGNGKRDRNTSLRATTRLNTSRWTDTRADAAPRLDAKRSADETRTHGVGAFTSVNCVENVAPQANAHSGPAIIALSTIRGGCVKISGSLALGALAPMALEVEQRSLPTLRMARSMVRSRSRPKRDHAQRRRHTHASDPCLWRHMAKQISRIGSPTTTRTTLFTHWSISQTRLLERAR